MTDEVWVARRLGQGLLRLDGHEVALPSWTAAQAEDWF
jgi:hypothetical protein